MKAFRAIARAASVLLALFMLSQGAAFAANDKSYTLTVSPASGTGTTHFVFTFVATGNSSFNALTLSLPTTGGYAFLPGATVTASRGTASFVSGGVKVEAINVPVGTPNEQVTVTITGVTATGTCGSGGTSGTWSAQPWTGSTVGSGQKFSLPQGGSFPSTTVGPTCFTITATASPTGGGTVTPAGVTNVVSGGSQAYSIVATSSGDPAYYTTDVKIDGTSNATALASGSYTFTNVVANHTIDATFAKKSLSIASPPTGATAGTPFNVVVGVTPGALISFDGNTSTCGATFGSPSFSAGNTIATIAVTIPNIPPGGTCDVTIASTGYGSAKIANITVTGILDCAQYWSGPGNPNDPSMDPDNDTAYVGTSTIGGLWGLRRGQNTDPTQTPCVPVNFTFLVNPDNTASFTYDKTGTTPPQSSASFKYVVLWNAVPVDPNGASQGFGGHRPLVSWGIPNPVVGPSDYVPALMCTDDGSASGGFASLSPTQLTALLPTIPDDRAVTTGAPSDGPFATAYASGRTQYQWGLKAKICVAQQGQTSVGLDGSGNVLIQYWDKFIDESDSFIKMP
jgi:hypothetical protein